MGENNLRNDLGATPPGRKNPMLTKLTSIIIEVSS